MVKGQSSIFRTLREFIFDFDYIAIDYNDLEGTLVRVQDRIEVHRRKILEITNIYSKLKPYQESSKDKLRGRKNRLGLRIEALERSIKEVQKEMESNKQQESE